jgi:hypothetical protein
METAFKGKNVIKWALSLGIIVVLNLFFAVAIQTVYPAPEYENFCPQTQVNKDYTDEASCVAVGGQWNEYMSPKPIEDPERTGWCNPDYTCSLAYQDANKEYARNVFVTLVILGALSIMAGFALRISPAVSAGLSYGGVLSFIIATMRYWGEAGDIVRLAIVAVALVALIGIGVRKFRE